MELPYTKSIIEKVEQVIKGTKIENIETYNLDFQKGAEVMQAQISKNVSETKAVLLK